jgi:hypothetical protein
MLPANVEAMFRRTALSVKLRLVPGFSTIAGGMLTNSFSRAGCRQIAMEQ